MGVTPDTAIWNTLYQIAGILAAVVMVAGISLVYNSFAISVAERTRQFGLLSSLGASRRQLRRTVLTEALVIGVAGIPAGLALGLAGCYVVFGILGEGIALMARGAEAHVAVSPVVLGIAALLGLVTLLVSAWILPSARAASRPSTPSARCRMCVSPVALSALSAVLPTVANAVRSRARSASRVRSSASPGSSPIRTSRARAPKAALRSLRSPSRSRSSSPPAPSPTS